MHTNGRDAWYILDVRRRMKKMYRSQAQARHDFVKWSEEEPGRYQLLRYHNESGTFLND